MFRLLTFSIFLLGLTAGLSAQYKTRTVPEGTPLANGMVTPIFVESLDPAGDTPLLRIRLRDNTGYRLNLFAERETVFDAKGEATTILRLYLHQPPRKPGAENIEPKSKAEKTLITALSVGLEHYTPGWTKNWSMEGHRELKALVHDLRVRQRAR